MNTAITRNKNPYKSTNIYRVTASLNSDFFTLNPFEKIERARKIIFTFDYPTPENVETEEFKQYFETMFISRFWERFFGSETFEAWTIRFYSKMLEVMPVYSELLTVFFDENKDKLFLNYSKSKTTTKNDSTNKSTDKNINSAFPSSMMKAGSNVGDVNYANNGALNNGESEQNFNGIVESEIVSGVVLDGVIKFNKEFKTIFSDLLNEFSTLFSAIIDI